MKFELSKEDIIELNNVFEPDKSMNNEASLDFALSTVKDTEDWIKALAYLTRSILLDHVFHDGNKRTAALLIKAYAEYEGHQTYDDKLLVMIKKVILKNITNIGKLEEMVRDVVK